jgi:hypothetical protein
MRMKSRNVQNAVEKWKLATLMMFCIGIEERAFGHLVGAVGFTALHVRSVVMWSFISIRRRLSHE